MGAQVGSVTFKGYVWSISIIGNELTMTRLGKAVGNTKGEDSTILRHGPIEGSTWNPAHFLSVEYCNTSPS